MRVYIEPRIFLHCRYYQLLLENLHFSFPLSALPQLQGLWVGFELFSDCLVGCCVAGKWLTNIGQSCLVLCFMCASGSSFSPLLLSAAAELAHTSLKQLVPAYVMASWHSQYWHEHRKDDRISFQCICRMDEAGAYFLLGNTNQGWKLQMIWDIAMEKMSRKTCRLTWDDTTGF